DGEEVRLRKLGAPHPGYHFLAYDWRNLLPTCEGCNLAKGNRFQTGNEYWAEERPQLSREEPLLVHPSHQHPRGLPLFSRDGLEASGRRQGGTGAGGRVHRAGAAPAQGPGWRRFGGPHAPPAAAVVTAGACRPPFLRNRSSAR